MTFRNYVCQGQSVTLFFKFSFDYVPDQDPVLEIEYDSHLFFEKESQKLTSGIYNNVTKREATITFTMPDNVTNAHLSMLGKYSLKIGSRVVFQGFLPDVQIFTKDQYFEKIIVPSHLKKIGFHIQSIGGPGEPDIIASHKYLNQSEIFDVEPTISATYNLTKFRTDQKKFDDFKESRYLSRLLIVSLSNNIEGGVLSRLSTQEHPHSLITVEDLYNLKKHVEKTGDHSFAVATLSKTGLISYGSRTTGFNWLQPKLFPIDIFIK